jgi:hypothetical protein
VAAGVSVLNTKSGQTLQQCLNGASTQAQVRQCNDQFRHNIGG